MPLAASPRTLEVPAEVARLVDRATAEPEQAERSRVFGRVQQGIDEAAWIVPLYEPRRFAVVRAGVGAIQLIHDSSYRFRSGPASAGD